MKVRAKTVMGKGFNGPNILSVLEYTSVAIHDDEIAAAVVMLSDAFHDLISRFFGNTLFCYKRQHVPRQFNAI